MTQQQAEMTLEEVRRLQIERERIKQMLDAVDARIRAALEIEHGRRPSCRKPLSGENMRRLCGVPV